VGVFIWTAIGILVTALLVTVIVTEKTISPDAALQMPAILRRYRYRVYETRQK